ncbi:MAG: DUF3387 domain-containing protein, partial [Candidatus Altiarchaeota archaeon]
RVNRVFKDKPAGLIVDYIGIADDLRKSLSKYTIETIEKVLTDINKVINLLKEKYDIVSSMFYGIDYKNWKILKPEELSQLTVSAYNLLDTEEKKKNFIKNFVTLKKIYALASPHPETIKIKDDIRFFEMIKKMIVKYSAPRPEISRDIEYEINQLISKSISAEEPVDIFSLLQKEKPEISIFDEEFLAEFKSIKQKNYAAEVLSKIMNDQIIVKMKINPVRYHSLYEKLKEIIEKYNLKRMSSAEVIEKLVNLAHEIKKQIESGKQLNLTEEELAFYDLLCKKEKFFENKEDIRKVVKEIIKELGGYIKVADWNRKEFLKAKIKTTIKRILINAIDGRADYNQIDQLSIDVVKHVETLYMPDQSIFLGYFVGYR